MNIYKLTNNDPLRHRAFLNYITNVIVFARSTDDAVAQAIQEFSGPDWRFPADKQRVAVERIATRAKDCKRGIITSTRVDTGGYGGCDD